MAISAAVNVDPLHADIPVSQTSITPPFGWPEKTDNRRASGDGEVHGACVAADANLGSLRQFIEAL
jgi:hypothetical protein